MVNFRGCIASSVSGFTVRYTVPGVHDICRIQANSIVSLGSLLVLLAYSTVQRFLPTAVSPYSHFSRSVVVVPFVPGPQL